MNDKVNMRMCVCCKQKFDRNSLVRVYKKDGGVYYDQKGKAGGRGAYLCSYGCLVKSFKTGKLSKALKCPVSADTLNILESVLCDGE